MFRNEIDSKYEIIVDIKNKKIIEHNKRKDHTKYSINLQQLINWVCKGNNSTY